MTLVRFTHYVRPHGYRTSRILNFSDDVAEKAKQIQYKGFDLTIEVLSTGEISATIEAKDRDVAIVISLNDYRLHAAIEKMIMDFDLDTPLELEEAAEDES